jgi:hypothetical protein
MNIVIIILLVFTSIVVLFLFLALFMRKDHFVKRDIVINSPQQKVFDFLRLLRNQDKFNKWAKTDPDRKEEFKGTDGTVGYVYSWSGNKNAGEGSKEIKNIIEGKRIETEIHFTKPMKVSASVIMETESISENQTKVYLINSGKLPYPINIMIPMFEKNFAKQMDESLRNLKGLLEE